MSSRTNMHTGPWRIEGGFDADTSISIVDENDFEICELDPFDGDWMPEEVQRARLIAAAPDLLGACKIVKAFLDGLENAERLVDDSVLVSIRREVHAPLRAALEPAIAKAEGA
jgi:hypothetical protein